MYLGRQGAWDSFTVSQIHCSVRPLKVYVEKLDGVDFKSGKQKKYYNAGGEGGCECSSLHG